LPRHFVWDSSVYFVGSLPDQGIANYTRLDSRIAWRLGERAEFSVVGQNLLTPRHEEFGDDAPLHTEVKRTVFGKIAWNF
jgi:hypothetical protein